MCAEVRQGLSCPQKELPPKFFYDTYGSELFEQITSTPEYYPTRTERGLLEALMPRWVRELRPVGLLELGAGSAGKSRIILDAMRAAGTLHSYVPVDVSAEFLAETARRLRAEYPGLRVTPAVADITVPLAPPTGLQRPALFAFLGSTIGNFPDADAVTLLRRVADLMQPGDRFLMGADLIKNRDPLEAAYNDDGGVTAEFNLNVLRVLNRDLGADFALDGFRHRAFFNAVEARIEMHLVSTRSQTVRVPGAGSFAFKPGETIRTEISRKFDRATLDRMFAAAGMRIERWETDAAGWYGLMLAAPVPVAAPPRRMRVASRGPQVAALREDLRAGAFALGDGPVAGPQRIGAEIEFIVHGPDGRPCPIEAGAGCEGSLAFLRRYGLPLGWVEERSPKGTPRFALPGRGTLAFEPGGQLEFSSLPCTSASGVTRILHEVTGPLVQAAEDHGLRMLEVGIDPHTPVEEAPLLLHADRYVRMARYFASIGPAGAVMMRQTAAFHVNLDFGRQNMLRWRVLNAAAPWLTAIFANSPVHGGRHTGMKSARAGAWRSLDPARTGVLNAGPVSEDEYLEFALGAPAMLLGTQSGYRPFAEHWGQAPVSLHDWHEHLSTLFPEIRPRGYLEVRCIDALPAAWYPVPLVLLAGLVYDSESLLAASDLLGEPNAALLGPAGAAGLADPEIGPSARDLFAIGLEGARRLGPAAVARNDLEVAEDFHRRYTSRGRSPADDRAGSV